LGKLALGRRGKACTPEMPIGSSSAIERNHQQVIDKK
jgi:hypothetical protein